MITATLRPTTSNLQAVVRSGTPPAQARVVAIGAAPVSLGNLSDVDLSEVADGAVLVYDSLAAKFVATTTVENDNTKIVGGSF